jgi:hypothetical protein
MSVRSPPPDSPGSTQGPSMLPEPKPRWFGAGLFTAICLQAKASWRAGPNKTKDQALADILNEKLHKLADGSKAKLLSFNLTSKTLCWFSPEVIRRLDLNPTKYEKSQQPKINTFVSDALSYARDSTVRDAINTCLKNVPVSPPPQGSLAKTDKETESVGVSPPPQAQGIEGATEIFLASRERRSSWLGSDVEDKPVEAYVKDITKYWDPDKVKASFEKLGIEDLAKLKNLQSLHEEIRCKSLADKLLQCPLEGDDSRTAILSRMKGLGFFLKDNVDSSLKEKEVQELRHSLSAVNENSPEDKANFLSKLASYKKYRPDTEAEFRRSLSVADADKLSKLSTPQR